MAIFLRRVCLYGCLVARYDAKDVVESNRDLLSERATFRKRVALAELKRWRKRLIIAGVARIESSGREDPDLVGDERDSNLDGLRECDC